ncbi:MAG: hypothetical protein JWL72_93, partial [Ilumatobacteraceae bacterium]|nr:hypothetical protein [Ilumatobacteraceae bacterium]
GDGPTSTSDVLCAASGEVPPTHVAPALPGTAPIKT